MTDQELAARISEDSFEWRAYRANLASENAKVNARNRGAPENSPARVEARAWDLTKAVLSRMAERVAA